MEECKKVTKMGKKVDKNLGVSNFKNDIDIVNLCSIKETQWVVFVGEGNFGSNGRLYRNV